jgi:acyl carrier protein
MDRETLVQKVRAREAIIDRVRRVLIESLGVRREPSEIDPDAPLFGTGLGLDSVDAVELVVSLETEFGIHFPPGAMSRRVMRTVGSVADAVLYLQSQKEQGEVTHG